MAQFVDRRLNPRDKSLGNRQRFLRRVRSEVKRAVDKAVTRTLDRRREQGRFGFDPYRRHRRAAVSPVARHGGERDFVFPATRSTSPATPSTSRSAGGGGGGGSEPGRDAARTPSPSHSPRRSFSTFCSRISSCRISSRLRCRDSKAKEFRRAGYSTDGVTPNLAVLRTMRVSMGRRLALRRPSAAEVEELERELEALQAIPEAEGDADDGSGR